MASPPLPIPVLPTDRVHSAGDSFIESWGNTPAPGGGVISQVAPLVWGVQLENAGTIAAATAAGEAIAGGAPRTGSITVPTLIPWTQNGASGTTIGHLASNVQTRIIDYNPTLLWILVSQNDLGTSEASWRASATTVMNAVNAQLPACRTVFVGCMSGLGEQWTTASGWGSNPEDANCLRINTFAETFAGERSCYWLNIRGVTIADPNTILNWEATHNLPEPGSVSQGTQFSQIGPRLTWDGGHPTIDYGQRRIAEMLFANLDLSAL